MLTYRQIFKNVVLVLNHPIKKVKLSEAQSNRFVCREAQVIKKFGFADLRTPGLNRLK